MRECAGARGGRQRHQLLPHESFGHPSQHEAGRPLLCPRGTHIRVALKAVCCDISRMGRACRRAQGWFFRLPSKTLAQSLSFIMWLTTFPQTVTKYFRRHISITVMLLKTFFFSVLPFCKITVFILIQKLFLSELFSAKFLPHMALKRHHSFVSKPGVRLWKLSPRQQRPPPLPGSSC